MVIRPRALKSKLKSKDEQTERTKEMARGVYSVLGLECQRIWDIVHNPSR